ncbi:zeatin O-glucosyltransferase-like isoform X1 [Amaranthus tricolor]|uniref:zeatin O-glucosyltransferase-like isoform X1 n=1 Tax=Amaranthus tricolor TaxID=29722 RepID=UPI002589544F|nr:zeatin O-glucosyltransferase-like isoform X1 [Amaranthus tricolor]
MEDQITLLMVPFPSHGHLNPLLHLSHLMIFSYNIPIHFISTHTHQPKIHIHGYGSISSTNKIHFHDFQLPSLPLLEASTHLRQPIYNLLIKLAKNFRRIIVIHDLIMSNVVQDFKLLSNVETYVFNPISAFTYFLGVWESIPKEMKPFELDLNDVLECSIPSSKGCVTPDVLEFTMNQYKYLGSESGWVYNTSRILEGKYVHLLEMLSSRRLGVKHFAFGPFNPVEFKGQLLLDHSADNSEENRHECLKWLDEQEKDSVIYIAFGSTTSLKNDQIQELANGLERSMEKFLWVMHEVEENSKIKRFHDLEKFEERVKGRGIIVRDWAPQLEILAHSSIGGFISHCGWNSCIESISMGVPIVAWPIQYDQPRNATLICGVLKVGMMVRDWEHHEQLVMSNTIEKVVKMLMKSKEGNEMRQRSAMLGEILRGSIGEGGVSSVEREAFFAHINR